MNDVEVFKHFFEKTFECPAIKLVAGFFLGILHLFYGNEVRAAYVAIPLLCLLDFVTGYYHARQNPKITPTSAKLRAGLVKILVYSGILLVAYQFSRFPLIAVLQGVFESSIMLTEGFSVLENIDKISKLHGYNIPIVTKALKMIQGKVEDLEGKNESN